MTREDRFRPRKRFGQHFLAPAWADKVVAAIAPASGDRFLEIGPGPGVLTTRLAARAAHVTAVEIDRDLAASLRGRVPPNVDIVVADVLKVDLSNYAADGPLRVAGNLPYNISTPILFQLLEKRGLSPFFAKKGDSHLFQVERLERRRRWMTSQTRRNPSRTATATAYQTGSPVNTFCFHAKWTAAQIAEA